MKRALITLAALSLVAPVLAHQPGHGSHGAPSGSTASPKADTTAQPASDATRTSLSHDEAARQYFTDRKLIDQNGRALRFYTDVLRNKVILINFIFTECQDTCPIQSQKLAEVQKLLQGQMGKDLGFVSISVDPQRDTPAVLKDYSRRFEAGEGWLFLTGNKDDVSGVIQKLGQLTPSVEGHSTLFILGNVATGHWMKLRPDTASPVIAEHLRKLASEKPASAAASR